MKVAVIGAGNLGGAIADALTKAGGFELTVSNPSEGKLERFARQGVAVTTDNCEAAAGADLVIIAVKPWIMEEVLGGITSAVDCSEKIIVSTAAATCGEQLRSWAGVGPRLFTAIPNTAISNLQSMTFLVPVLSDDSTTALVKGVFDRMGETLVIEEDRLFAGTSLASCGIAYALSYLKASAEGGEALGFTAEEAKSIVLQTVRGAVGLLEKEGADAGNEIRKVTTPGGLTEKGLAAMRDAGFTEAVIKGLKASFPREK